MNLKKKKALAARALNTSRDKIIFIKPRLDEIKEAITKQDIRDLYNDGAIIVKGAKGRKSTRKRKNRSSGNVKIKIKTRKRKYVILTRTLRKYASQLKKQGKISKEELQQIRRMIKNKEFRNKTYLKSHVKSLGERRER